MKLRPEEKETHLYFDEGNDECEVVTFNRKLGNKARKFSKLFPKRIKITKDEDGEVWFTVSKKLISINIKNPNRSKKTREVSEEE